MFKNIANPIATETLTRVDYLIHKFYYSICMNTRGRPITGADIKHFYDYRVCHFQNRFAYKIVTFRKALFGSDAACRDSPLCGI